MTILSRVGNAWNALWSKSSPTPGWGYAYGYGPYFSDAFRFRRAPSPVDLVEAYKSLIYTCANLNANAVAAGNLKLYVLTKGGQARPKCGTHRISLKAKQRLAPLAFKAIGAHADEIEEVTEHPLLHALISGNDELDLVQFLQYMSLSLDIVGSGYAWPDTDDGPVPSAFWALPPHYVNPVWDGASMVPDHYQFGSLFYDRHDLVRIRRLSMKNPYGRGYAPAQAAIEYARLEDTFVSVQDDMLSNGPRPSLVVSHKDPQGSFGQAERTRLTHELNQKTRGGRAGSVVVVDGAAAIAPLDWKPADLGGLNISTYDMERCANCFDIPISMLTNESSNRAVADAGLEQHARNAVEPRHKVIASGFTRWTHEFGRGLGGRHRRSSGYERLFWAFDPAVQADKQAEAELNKIHVDMGAVTRNEVRLDLGYEPMDGADDLLVPNNLVPIGQLGASDALPAESEIERPAMDRDQNDSGKEDEARETEQESEEEKALRDRFLKALSAVEARLAS